MNRLAAGVMAVFFACTVFAAVPAYLAPPSSEEFSAEAAQRELQARVEQLGGEIAELEGRLDDGPMPESELQRLQLLRDQRVMAEQLLTLYSRLPEDAQVLEDVRAQRAQLDSEGLGEEPPYTIARLDALEDEAASAARVVQVTQVQMGTERDILAQRQRALVEAQQAVRRVREEALQDSTRQAELRLALMRERRAELNLAMQRAELAVLQQRVALWSERTALFRGQAARVRPAVVFEEEGLAQRLEDIGSRRERLEQELRTLERQRADNDRAVGQARGALQQAQESEDVEAVARAQERLTARLAWLDASSQGVQYLERRLAGLYDEEVMWQRRYAVLNGLETELYEAWAVETAGIRGTLADVRGYIETRVNELRTAQDELENRAGAAPESIADMAALDSRREALKAMEGHARGYLTNIAGRQGLANRLSSDLSERLDALSWWERAGRAWSNLQVYWHYEVFVVDDRPFTLGRVAPALGVFLLVLLSVYLAKLFLMKVVLRRVVREQHEYSSLARDLVLALSKSTAAIFVVFLAVYAGSRSLPLSVRLNGIVVTVMTIALMVQVGIWVNDVMQRQLETSRRRREARDPSSVSAYGLMSVFGRIAIWAVVFLLVLRSLGQDITAIVAGLGIGGIAVAFALQNILGDIFCSVAILLDKPFVVGDFIVVGDQKGSVEHIGIKTTRVRSLSGEQIIFSNADLMGSRIQNFKRMYERRAGFEFGVVYETPREKVARIPEIVREIIDACDKARFDRSHFARFGDYSLDFETVYYVGSAEYAAYMDIQQHINLELFRIFEEEGISFAYPTRELIVRGYGETETVPAPLEAAGEGGEG